MKLLLNGTPFGSKQANGKVRFSDTPYGHEVAKGYLSGHTPWTKIGYTPTMTTAVSDLWSKAGAYTFASAPSKWDVLGENAADLGTIIFSGTSSGGSTTTLIDATKNFAGGTAVEVGDCIILDKSGTTPEWGYVTGVGATTLTVAGGFSSGGTGSGRAYAVVDKNTAGKTGAHAVKIEYLTSAYAEKSEIVILNGNAAVDCVNTDFYRVNSFRVIATGSGGSFVAVGNLSLRVSGGAATYSYITAGFTRARNSVYTVPAGKTLYVSMFNAGWSLSAAVKDEYCRIFTRANREPSTGFSTGSIFYPYSEVIVKNSTITIHFEVPTKLTAGTDIKVSGIATAAGTAVCALRGWLETN